MAEGSVAASIALLVLAGAMNASFTLPMKFTRAWAWENIWAVWSFWALLVFPIIAAFVTVPDLTGVYARAGISNFLLVAVCGVAWGAAQVLFGLAVDSIGIALAFTIVMGLSAASGSLIPLLQLHAGQALSPAGIKVIEGVALVIAGVIVCAIAGRRREAVRAVLRSAPQTSTLSPAAGLVCAVLSGLGASAMNIAITYGAAMIAAATETGTHPAWRTNTIWLPLMVAGAIPNLAYCFFLMRRNRTLRNFNMPAARGYWAAGALMAGLWFGSSLLYGAASGALGTLGAVLGWPVFMSMIVIVASLLGFVTGEWKNTGQSAWRIQAIGVGILVVAVIVLSRAGQPA